jgi:hypothetical protein
MGLETGTGIGDLVPTNPLSTDVVSSGDDHIRLIKTVMQSITFLKSIQSFTASGTWTRPANVKKIIIYCLGGGGGGNGGTIDAYSGGSGSSGAVAIKLLDVSAIASATVTIGAGGIGGTAPAGLGSPGGDTTFTTAGPVTQCQAKGGINGGIAHYPGGVHARNISTGDIIFPGHFGMFGDPSQSGSASFGGQGGGNGGYSAGDASPNSGGGGGGGFVGDASSAPGGAGGSGYCIVMEYGW